METGGETGGPFYTYIKRLNELVVTMYRFSCWGAPTHIVYILFFFHAQSGKKSLVSLSLSSSSPVLVLSCSMEGG